MALPAVGAVVQGARRRLAGAYTIDPWGLDGEVHAAVAGVVGVRWSLSIAGQAHVPAVGPALLVANDRFGTLAPLAGLIALGRDVGRVLRFVGVPDVEPLATALRRLGGVLERPDELAAILCDGQIGVVWCRSPWRSGQRVGPVRSDLLVPAVDQKVPVCPVAVHGRRLGRVLRVEVGPPVAGRNLVGPLAPVELAAGVRIALQNQLDEAAPPTWLWH